ncbi:MAG: SusC/RagA family TonB-linked outer membrane protein [Arachidicoccus sp.]|nr:SusC/RagA family TonB-linked outer membrane protein [Arachidicoccus sp.]
MKLLPLLLLITVFHVVARSNAQNVTLSLKSATLDKVFNLLSRQTGYSIVYTKEMITGKAKVNIQVANESLRYVLDDCLQNSGLIYSINNKIIVIKEAPRFLALTDLTDSSSVVLEQPVTHEVRVHVLDSLGRPLPGAGVAIKGSKKGGLTNTEGFITLHGVNEGDVLEISYVGYIPQNITVGDNFELTIHLKAIPSSLNDIVIVGYGSARKLDEVPGSVVTVQASVIQQKPTANMLDELQGKVPGLQIYSSSGEPSNTPSIRLNGVGSLGASSTPLFVMDGIPIDPSTVLSLNPEDFESITVLRDAAATSIYGARAANGVILLTSKKGTLNSSKIAVNTQYGVSNFTNNTLNLYKDMMNSAQYESFVVAAGIKTQAQLDAALSSLPYKPADTKWYKVFYRQNTPTYSMDMNVSGGGGKTTYYISGGYFNQEGLAWRSGYDKYNFRANINSVVKDWFQMGINLVGAFEQAQTNPYGSNQLNRGLAELILPYYSNKDSNGVEYPNLMAGSNRYNPKYLAKNFPDNTNQVQLNPTGYIQLTPTKGLTLKSTAGIEFYDFRESSERLPSYVGALNSGSVSESFARAATKNITNTAEYKFTVAQHHHLTALAGQEFIAYTATSFGASNAGFTDDRLLYLQQGSTTGYSASSSEDQYSFFSLFGRVSYNFDTKYFLDLSVRNDESSRFGTNNRNALFYSVGASWSAKKESFLSNVSWLNDLIVKASIGTSGNAAIGDYAALPTVGTITAYNTATSWSIGSAGNPDLTWEKQRQINIGFQATVFNRLHLDAEYFDRLTTHMLFDVPYPYTSGFSSVTSNVGGLSNKGINANVSVDVISGKKGFLTLYANAGYVQQKVTSLFQGKQSWTLPNTGITYVVGQAVSFYEPIFAYIDPANGNPLWYVPGTDFTKTNKDPKNLTSNFNSTTLLQNTGIKMYSPFNGGFGLNGGYKGFSVAADFTFSSGKYLLNNDEYFFNNPTLFGGSYNQSVAVLDYWKQPGDIARYPNLNNQFTQFDSRLIENASFVRLKNLTIAYSLPKNLLDKTNKVISGVKFYVTFRNLLTFTKFPGPDPEIDSNLGLGVNPNTRQTVGGINIQF